MRKNLPVTTNEYVLPASEVIVTHTDLKGRVTYASDGFVRASGYSRKECMGQPHNFVRHPDMPAAGFADLWDTIQKGRPWTGLVKNRRKNGDYYWVRANASPIMRDGQIVGYMSVRTAPSRAEIQAAEALYAAINEGRANHLRLSGGILYHTGWRGQVEAILNLPLAIRLWMTIGGLGALFIALACGEWLSGGKYALLLTIVELASATLAFASAAYMSHRLAGPMNDLIATAKRICAGEIRLRFEETGDSEVVQFARLLNQMNANLAGVLTDVNGAFEHVDRATMEVAQGNIDLSSRTEEQASSLEETASAMEQLTSSVKQNADHAKHSNQLTASASEVAIEGGNAVREVVHTMSAISESSKKIANIIGVIDGIAFQTNILALNAAVEAARAGEQGRGFAVVASEVRNLAQRSAAAAKEIKELIAESSNKVDAGTRQVHEAGETMDHIVSSVRRVTDIMAEITAATLEQSQGIEEMSTAVQQMDEVTQQNAALVEEAAAAAESLREQGEQIGIAIGVFNFGTGRADKRGSASAKPTTKAHAEKTAIPRLPAAPTPSPAAGETEWEEF